MTYSQYPTWTKYAQASVESDPYSTADSRQNDGYIHLSTAEQVPTTVGQFFNTTKQVLLYVIRFCSGVAAIGPAI